MHPRAFSLSMNPSTALTHSLCTNSSLAICEYATAFDHSFSFSLSSESVAARTMRSAPFRGCSSKPTVRMGISYNKRKAFGHVRVSFVRHNPGSTTFTLTKLSSLSSSSLIFPSAYAVTISLLSAYLTPNVSKSFSFLALAHRSRRFIHSFAFARVHTPSLARCVNDPTNTTVFFIAPPPPSSRLSFTLISSLHSLVKTAGPRTLHIASRSTPPSSSTKTFLSALHSAAQ
mmetsp:Transcript_5500/g.17373  ORF Transcript_5500/g.17373 Transcript_5500/m.17373 type:complete len:230 (+) Transcript_5500:7593-8282(+)